MKKNLQKNQTNNTAGHSTKKIRKRIYLLYLVLIIWAIVLFIVLTS